MPRRNWQELTNDSEDIGIHLRLARNFPGTDCGRASTQTLLKHYREAAEIEMRAHNNHLAGRLREGEFLGARVDPMIQDWFNWLSRKIFLSDDPVEEVKRLIGSASLASRQSVKKSKQIKKLEKTPMYFDTQLSFEEFLSPPADPAARRDRNFNEFKASLPK